MATLVYPSDLTDEQWALLEPMLPPPKPGGRPRSNSLRTIINGIFYLVRSGCSWRMLPRDFGPWGTVHFYYWTFRTNGLWEKIHDTLREEVRHKAGRKRTPSAAILDSQSIKTTEKGGSMAMTQAKRLTAANAICS